MYFFFLTFINNCLPNFSTSEPRKDQPQTNGSRKIPSVTIKPPLSKSKTQISSIYTKLSSIKPTNTTASNNKSSSIPNFLNSKSVKTTQIGSCPVSPLKMSNIANSPRSPVKSPNRIPQLVKPSLANKVSSKSLISFIPKSDDSNGNSATSSLSTSSSNSSLNNNSVSPVRRFV